MANSPFLSALEGRIVIGDGAMGTYLYSKGIPLNQNFDSLNLTQPDLVASIHREYIGAGAELIETNTFTANRARLKRFGLEGKVREINVAGARLAKKQAGNIVFVAGSVGPLTGAKKDGETEWTLDEKYDIFAEQILALAEGGCDVLILETFTDLVELKCALKAAKGKTKLPALCQMTFSEKGRTPHGVSVKQAVAELEKAGADVIGTNCGFGPLSILHVVEEMTALTHARISAFPNAGLPQYHDGRFMYLSTPQYIAEMAERMVQAGANLVGGCCGTTPADIKAIAQRLKGRRPVLRKDVPVSRVEVAKEAAPPKETPKKTFFDKLGKELVLTMELDPPKGMGFEKVIKNAVALHEAGVDAITVGDNPLAVLRMGNLGVAHLMECEGVPTIAHISCRDKNLIALQSAVMEAAALEITSLLAITGDPARVGDQPGASSVYDMNSFELIRLIRQMNEGKNLSGNSMGRATRFSIGCAFNPNVRDWDNQIRRLKKKIENGAQYALSQPFYDGERIGELYAHLKKAVGDFPVFFGVLPLMSASNAEFLNAEVPGIKIPQAVIARMKAAPPERQRAEGIKIAKELIEQAAKYAPGIYMVPPFGRIDVCMEIAGFISECRKKWTHSLGK